MHYLCLVYSQEDVDDSREVAEADEAHALVASLTDGGYDISAMDLAPSHEATSLRVTGGGVVLTDGPVISGPPHLKRAYVLRARDLNDAVRMAAWLPEAHSATIEIRPVTGRPPQAGVTPQPAPAAPTPPNAASSEQPANAAD